MKKDLSTLLGSSLLAAGLTVASSAFIAPAQALTFGFGNISNNNATNAATGQNQLFLNVTDAVGGNNLSSTQALFKFSNIGPNASSITQIYFDDQVVSTGRNNTTTVLLNNIAGITDSGAGVDFSISTGNLNLPSGNNAPGGRFTEDFGIEPNSPVAPNGVNPGEWVSVLFNLKSGKTLQNVFDGLTSGLLRVGFHVQAFSNGGSETFVNNRTPLSTSNPSGGNPSGGNPGGGNPSGGTPGSSVSVPEPSTLTGLALFFGGMVASRRRKPNKDA